MGSRNVVLAIFHALSVLAAILLGSQTPTRAQEPEPLLDAAEAAALDTKQQNRAVVIEKLKQADPSKIQRQPAIRGIGDYPRGRFENLKRNRLQWVTPNWFQFVPKANSPFTFVRSNGERIAPKNFFTDGGSIPRIFRWSDDLDPFGSLPPYLIHDWEFDLHHCKQSKKTFEEVASSMMEAMRTLIDEGYVKYNGFVFWMIETGIQSFVARELWDTIPKRCPLPAYNPE